MLLSVVLRADPPAPAGWSWSSFLVSPGFGGAAAFLGALLVFTVGMSKGHDDRVAERGRQWWAAFTWTFERATTETSTPLGAELTSVLLVRLMNKAHTGLEREVISTMSEELLADDESPDEPPPTDQEGQAV